uniref:Uncharacterized protein n=1 Tax=Arundo donax TaxID=35708 RepID=A0A0A9H735_ARUDO
MVRVSGTSANRSCHTIDAMVDNNDPPACCCKLY